MKADRRSPHPAASRVDQLLADPAGWPTARPPRELRSRIMQSLRDCPAPLQAQRFASGWLWGAAAACALVAATLGLRSALTRPPATPSAPIASSLTTSVPLEPTGMIRLVTGSVDKPLLDQADRMISDTKRATQAVVRCVPFTGRGG